MVYWLLLGCCWSHPTAGRFKDVGASWTGVAVGLGHTVIDFWSCGQRQNCRRYLSNIDVVLLGSSSCIGSWNVTIAVTSNDLGEQRTSENWNFIAFSGETCRSGWADRARVLGWD